MRDTSPSTSLIVRAAANNAAWCDIVCRARGVPGCFTQAAWINRQPVPPYFPNVITLGGSYEVDSHRQAVAGLIQSGTDMPIAVKDCFAALDLADMGFDPLFDADWIALTGRHGGDGAWTRLRLEGELLRWQVLQGDHGGVAPILSAAQLTGDDVIVLWHGDAARPTGGAILNLAAGIVGISNVFARGVPETLVWCDLAGFVARNYPDKPAIGYEQGSTREAAVAAGFAVLGPLRVWLQRRG